MCQKVFATPLRQFKTEKHNSISHTLSHCFTMFYTLFRYVARTFVYIYQHLQRGHQWKPLHPQGTSIGHPLTTPSSNEAARAPSQTRRRGPASVRPVRPGPSSARRNGRPGAETPGEARTARVQRLQATVVWDAQNRERGGSVGSEVLGGFGPSNSDRGSGFGSNHWVFCVHSLCRTPGDGWIMLDRLVMVGFRMFQIVFRINCSI